jgi:hypothetical protein
VADKKPEAVVKSRNDKVSLTIYGQVNRAALYANDGDEGNWFFVDNDNSSTRIGLLGSTNAIDDFIIGTRFEVEFQSNPSNEVSQEDKNGVGDNNFKRRHFDIFVTSKRFGKLSLGYGSTASDNTAEVDLSGTDVVGYSSIADMAGGQFFFDNDTDTLSNATIGGVYSNFDGLGRDDRLRYDTPDFYGFAVSGSVISGDAADVALRYSAKLGDFKLAAAAAYSDPAGNSNSVDDIIDGSISVLHGSGSLATRITRSPGVTTARSTMANSVISVSFSPLARLPCQWITVETTILIRTVTRPTLLVSSSYRILIDGQRSITWATDTTTWIGTIPISKTSMP